MDISRSCLFFTLLFALYGFSLKQGSSESSSVKLQMEHRFNGEQMRLHKTYTTLLGDKISITKFKYYVSNIKLMKADGTHWKQPNSYHLVEVNEEAATYEIKLDHVPQGEYKQISFAIGIDSVSNHSGEQAGALDPDHGMFWMWETGYVFFKCEGFYHTPQGEKGAIVYHIGRDNCYRNVTLDLKSEKLSVSKERKNRVEITADVHKLFGGFPHAAIDVKIPTDHSSMSVMGGSIAPKIAHNYSQIFHLKSIRQE